MSISSTLIHCNAEIRIPKDNGNKKTVSMDYVMRNLGIDEKELENAEDIDIE